MVAKDCMIALNALQQKQLINLSIGFLCVLVLSALLEAISAWHADWMLINTTPHHSTIASPHAAALVAAIPSQHLFGKAMGSTNNLPITNLQLHVTGITKVEHETIDNPSRASISMAGQPSKLYEVGDEIAAGVKVYQIDQDAVVLQNDGELEKLPLPRAPLEFKPPVIEENLR